MNATKQIRLLTIGFDSAEAKSTLDMCSGLVVGSHTAMRSGALRPMLARTSESDRQLSFTLCFSLFAVVYVGRSRSPEWVCRIGVRHRRIAGDRQPLQALSVRSAQHWNCLTIERRGSSNEPGISGTAHAQHLRDRDTKWRVADGPTEVACREVTRRQREGHT